ATEKKKAAEEARANQERIAAEKKAAEDAKVSEKAAEKAAQAERAKTAEQSKAAEQNAATDKPVVHLAPLTPAEQAGEPMPKSDQPVAGNISRSLQTELRRVGCTTAGVEDNWGSA